MNIRASYQESRLVVAARMLKESSLLEGCGFYVRYKGDDMFLEFSHETDREE